MKRFTDTRHLLQFGIAGTLVLAVCCVTPALVVLLAALGLSAWFAWLDSLLIPLLVVFIVITVYAVMVMVSVARHGGDENASGE
jgi:mercuric ion transport protein